MVSFTRFCFLMFCVLLLNMYYVNLMHMISGVLDQRQSILSLNAWLVALSGFECFESWRYLEAWVPSSLAVQAPGFCYCILRKQ